MKELKNCAIGAFKIDERYVKRTAWSDQTLRRGEIKNEEKVYRSYNAGGKE